MVRTPPPPRGGFFVGVFQTKNPEEECPSGRTTIKWSSSSGFWVWKALIESTHGSHSLKPLRETTQ